MSKTKIILLLMIILLLLSEHSPCAVDPYYTSCRPFQCGNLNITFPFYVDQHQPSYCGTIGNQYYPLKITCKNKHQPFINLSGDSYLITNISYKQQIFHIINSALILNPKSSCPTSSIHNLTSTNSGKFLNYLDMMANTSEILLLQNCTNDVYNRIVSSRRDLLNCRNSRSSNKVSFTVYATDLKQGTDLINSTCGGVISVRYDDAASSSSATTRSIADDLRRGINLKWIANNCTRCEESGGSCGYTNTSEFKCFCPDRPHSGSCKMDDPAGHNNSSKRKKLIITISSAISGAILLLVIMHVIFFWCHRKIKQGLFKHNPRNLDRTGSNLEMSNSSNYGVPVFLYDDLKDATNNFDTAKELGEGGFGVVYHGILKDGREVAVKRLYEKNFKRIEQFINEIQILTSLRHKNLVTLYGCTSRHSRELVLVYEYIPNKTVADHLHDAKLLTWAIRMKIAIETAAALSYLHASDIIHRDVKTNNILLDNEFNVKVADFGLSRLFPSDVTHVSTAPQGTPGYVDPEYYQCYHLTNKSDVYSFGVVLTELLSSLPAVDTERPRHEINLSNYAMNRIHCCAFGELVDPNLGFESDFKIKRMTTMVAELAFQCLQHERELRPSMEEVLETLKRIDSADYDVLEAEEKETKAGLGGGSSGSSKPPLSPVVGGHDDVGLLRKAHQAPGSPDTVMDKWTSRSTTPNTSN